MVDAFIIVLTRLISSVLTARFLHLLGPAEPRDGKLVSVKGVESADANILATRTNAKHFMERNTSPGVSEKTEVEARIGFKMIPIRRSTAILIALGMVQKKTMTGNRCGTNVAPIGPTNRQS